MILSYTCPCGHSWEDVWECAVDGDCPECGITCEATELELAPPLPNLTDMTELPIEQALALAYERGRAAGYVEGLEYATKEIEESTPPEETQA